MASRTHVGSETPRRAVRSLLWWGVGVLAVLAVALGYLGFDRYDASLGSQRSVLDRLYASLQLFVLESGNVSGPVPATLQAARFLAPAVAGYAAVRGLVLLFRDRFVAARIGRRRGHAVVCGLGDRGLTFVRSLRAADRAVTVIEADAENDLIPAAEAEGALVLIGDARDPGVLRRARVDRAVELVAVSADDGANAEIAAAVQSIPRSGPDRLRALVHVTDPALCALLRTEELAAGRDGDLALDFFNVPEQGARRIAGFLEPALDAVAEPLLVVDGTTVLARHVIAEAARRRLRRVRRGALPLRIAVVGDHSESAVVELLRHYPRMAEAARLRAFPVDGDAGPWSDPERVTAVAVCAADDAAGLRAALQAQERLRTSPAPVVIGLAHTGGLAAALAGRETPLAPFGLLDAVCTAESLRTGTLEEIARSLDLHYQESIGPRRAWEDAGPQERASALDQAADVGRKLGAVACHLVPLADWSASEFRFTPAEVELLALLEHERWREWKRARGWTYGDPTDPDPKRLRNRNLREWEALDAGVQETNRRLIRALPAALADAGHEIARDDGPVARAVHDAYLEEAARRGRAADDAAAAGWDDLPEPLRASCRDQAAHIPLKLRTLGLAVGSLHRAVEFAPGDAEVEHLARMEHERWVAQRRADGWVPGPRDAAARTTPHLVPWEDLDDDMREWDRYFVRAIPRLLAAAGLAVVPGEVRAD